MAIPLSDFLKLVMPEVPSCPQPLALDKIREAAIEFCEQSEFLTEEVDITVTSGVSTAPVPTVTGLPFKIVSLKRDGLPLQKWSRSDHDGAWVQGDGQPTYYYFDAANNVLVLVPTPNANETLRARVVVRPADDVQDVNDELYQKYRLAIAARAKAMLFSMHGTPWYNLNEALKQSREYNFYVAKAVAERRTGYTNAGLMVNMRPAC